MKDYMRFNFGAGTSQVPSNIASGATGDLTEMPMTPI
jgi:hypothetical protein